MLNICSHLARLMIWIEYAPAFISQRAQAVTSKGQIGRFCWRRLTAKKTWARLIPGLQGSGCLDVAIRGQRRQCCLVINGDINQLRAQQRTLLICTIRIRMMKVLGLHRRSLRCIGYVRCLLIAVSNNYPVEFGQDSFSRPNFSIYHKSAIFHIEILNYQITFLVLRPGSS